jgi:methyltransferase (TIGR00027 family)
MTLQLLSFLVFLALQIVFLPLAVVGVVLVAYKQMVISKRLGVSQTGIEVLNGRWTMHVFDMRSDDATVHLAQVLPNTSTFGLWLCLLPLWIKYKISGTYFGYPRIADEGAERVADLVTARTLYFDRIIGRVIGDVEQFVLLGAGYDTRAYGELERDGLAIFELDQSPTQQLKIASLERADIDAAHVCFVQVDFSQEQAFEKLKAAGYDPRKKTLFLWEGVTLYLAEKDVRKTMRDIRDNAAEGSVVVADFYSEQFVKMGKKGSLGGKALDYTGEGLGFGLNFADGFEETLRNFLQSENMEPGATFFMGRTRKKGPFMVVAEFSVQ